MAMKEVMEDTQLSYAGGGSKEHEISEDDKKLLEAFHQLNVTPHIDSVGDLEMFMVRYGGKDDEPVRQPVVKQKTGSFHIRIYQQNHSPDGRFNFQSCPFILGIVLNVMCRGKLSSFNWNLYRRGAPSHRNKYF